MDSAHYFERSACGGLRLRITYTPGVDMQISVKETSVFSAFHPDAHDLFNTCSDLKKVAWELWDPKYRLNDKVCVQIQVRKSLTHAWIRTKECSYSELLRLCCVSDPHVRLKTRSKKCRVVHSLSKRNSTGSVCSFISVEMNTFIAQGIPISLSDCV